MLDHHEMVETTAEKIIILIGSCHIIIIIIMELKMHHNRQLNEPRMLIQQHCYD
jgi:hypothetical protein